MALQLTRTMQRCRLTSLPHNSCYHTSAVNPGMPAPPKKRGYMDPKLMAKMEEKRKKREEKLKKQLVKLGMVEIPIEENKRNALLEDANRQRPLDTDASSGATEEANILLFKDWQRVQEKWFLRERKVLRRAIDSQNKALVELRNVSEELYIKAVEPSEDLLPWETKMKLFTPKVEDYEPMDGEYSDYTDSLKPVFDKNFQALVNKAKEKMKRAKLKK